MSHNEPEPAVLGIGPRTAAVLLARLDALELAIRTRNWADVEFQFGRVASAAERGAGVRQRHYDRGQAPAGLRARPRDSRG